MYDCLASARADAPPSPYLQQYSNSGCLDGTRDDYPFCGDDAFELTLAGDTLHVLHANATYNCCPDDITVSLSVQGSLLRLTEEEILTMPCDCMCCYDVSVAVAGLAPGDYTVEYCWQDYETGQQQCYLEDITVPGPGGDLDGDGDVDLADFATFALCYAGAGVTAPPPGCAPAWFDAADLDQDHDTDLADFATFAMNYGGAP